MARTRRKAAARKADADEAMKVASGVLYVAREIVGAVEPGSLWWRAPFQFACEQAALHACRRMGLGAERRDEVAAYLLASQTEWFVGLMEHFDVEHFEAWTAAAAARESG